MQDYEKVILEVSEDALRATKAQKEQLLIAARYAQKRSELTQERTKENAEKMAWDETLQRIRIIYDGLEQEMGK
ncbi:hypothetical protein [Herbaspirillum sp. CAH-3]|uniref:hypothetical protein n=1 Tax=Herbaspirillum sp. CAH-3 TaxID=2605746 RepID=UPI0012AC731A|nr:hypothetical protein [Herbaspirillum sp. CAH-3]MRT30024.1 hypothetical protein [Herbaspirillum sp. CAH-3]